MIRMTPPKRVCISCLRWVYGPPKSIRCPICAKKHKNEYSKAINQRKRDARNLSTSSPAPPLNAPSCPMQPKRPARQPRA